MRDNKYNPPGTTFMIVLGCLGGYFIIDIIIDVIDIFISLFMR